MTTTRRVFLCLFLAAGVFAHPMGNFSVNHYSRLNMTSSGIQLTYVLDMAEIPTLELFQRWQVGERSIIEFQSKAEAQAAGLLANVIVETNGKRIEPRIERVNATLLEGAGGMQTARIVVNSHLPAGPGQLSYEDKNYADRSGWKEIVIRGDEGVSLTNATQTDTDLSHELTIYPANLSLAPPQDLRASVSWAVSVPYAPVSSVSTPMRVAHASNPSSSARSIAAAATSDHSRSRTFVPPQQASGTVTAGDFLSRMLRDKRFGIRSILLGFLAAFALGAFHALSPGHGKTIVAAYLIGSRGTLKHALLLGSTVTFTHTVSVFLLGLGVLFFQQYVVPERAIPIIGAISGLSIISVGAWLLYKRSMALVEAGASNSHVHHGEQHHHNEHGHADHHRGHAHHHAVHLAIALPLAPAGAVSGVAVLDSHHDQGPTHCHNEPHVHGDEYTNHEPEHRPHNHGHAAAFLHTHTHGGHTHSHGVPEGRIGLGGLLALGVSGGLVPCPSALILLLSAIALGHTALGLGLLLSFSTGLALVLMAIGALVLYARHLLPNANRTRRHPFFSLVPVFSAVVVVVMGLLMTMTALGLIQPIRYFG